MLAPPWPGEAQAFKPGRPPNPPCSALKPLFLFFAWSSRAAHIWTTVEHTASSKQLGLFILDFVTDGGYEGPRVGPTQLA